MTSSTRRPSRGRSRSTAGALLLLLGAFGHGTTSPVAAELVAEYAGAANGVFVVAHATAGFSRLDPRDVRKLFMGKARRLPDGSTAVLAGHVPSASRFNELALGRSDAAVRAAWARLRFSGRSRPIREFDSIGAIVAFVAATPHAIAWLPTPLPEGLDLDGVRTVYRAP